MLSYSIFFKTDKDMLWVLIISEMWVLQLKDSEKHGKISRIGMNTYSRLVKLRALC